MMSIVFLFLGCFLLYGKSKYFPEYLHKTREIIKDKKQIATVVGYLFLCISYAFLGNKIGWGTGVAIYIISLSFTYTLLLIVLSLHNTSIYIISAICVLLIIIIENSL